MRSSTTALQPARASGLMTMLPTPTLLTIPAGLLSQLIATSIHPFMKKEKKTPLGLMLFIGDLKIEFVPMKSKTFRIYVKGDEQLGKQGPFDLQDMDFLYWSSTQGSKLNTVLPNFVFKIIRQQNSYVLDFFPQMMIKYDGNSVQVLAGPQVKGQHCGMCGDYNRNTHYELDDPQVTHMLKDSFDNRVLL